MVNKYKRLSMLIIQNNVVPSTVMNLITIREYKMRGLLLHLRKSIDYNLAFNNLL